MALSRTKYKRVPDLYVEGTEIVLKSEGEEGPTVVWAQTLNPFERDEATHDAQIARARLTLALKQGDERQKVQAVFIRDGREVAIVKVAEYHSNQAMGKAIDDLAVDPDWSERVEIMNRSDDILAKPMEDAEQELLATINQEYLTEVLSRQSDERDFQLERLEKVTDDDLLEEYLDIYLERRGAEVASAEYQLTELWYALRVCAGVQGEDGKWDHSACESHALTVYETKAEVRALPDELQKVYFEAMGKLNMSVRDARFSARQGSSSDSSPLPSEAAESTPSIPVETLVGAPGI
jgi:hypothetical protein